MNKKNAPLFLSIIILFLIGGPLQLMGIGTPTQMNMLAISLFAAFAAMNYPARFGSVQKNSAILGLFCVYTFMTGIINGSNLSGFAVYAYYFLCTYVAIAIPKLALPVLRVSNNRLFRILILFVVFEILVATVQNFLSLQISAFSKTPLIPEDVVSGTFYLKSDASLAYFSIFLCITAFSLLRDLRHKLTIMLLSSAIVLLTQSKSSQGIFLIISMLLLMRSMIVPERKYMNILIMVMPLAIVIALLLFSDKIVFAGAELSSVLKYAFFSKDKFEEAHRLAPVGELLYGDIKYFGDGLLTYYNPIEKIWHYYSGFSLFYSLYFDAGIIAIPIFILWVVRFIFSKVKDFFYSCLYATVIIVYSFFNFTLTDMSLLFSLSLFLSMHQNKLSIHNEKALYLRGQGTPSPTWRI
ncbi:hypothetical protein D3C85_377270 [compost metagenome]|uniref:hypothetical protein n=1 Tax=Pseudomonas fluorescens TaxID=294 RepID=UPI000FA2B89A|nr:hypothetical protein [Pseudomonas fluorescens]VVP16488.1 hypothetical protein PS843_03549 [Pseudomonas fluorescens]